MLDLGKQYGTYRGISFYGDHEDEGLVYYLPNEVKLDKDKNSHYEMDLMLFSESNIVSKEAINFDDTAGAILQMGVICTVDERTLNRALDELRRTVGTLPENIRVMQPTWKEGTVDMMILDKQKDKQGDDSNTTGFVKSILGSQKPSFMTNDLKSIFNVRLDCRGSELVYKAIEGSKSSLAGVMYDLKFAALQPAANLRISANLSKCPAILETSPGKKIAVTASIGSETLNAFCSSRSFRFGSTQHCRIKYALPSALLRMSHASAISAALGKRHVISPIDVSTSYSSAFCAAISSRRLISSFIVTAI